MTPEKVLSACERGELSPVYLLVGEESYRRDAVTAALRAAVTRDGIAGLNDDHFTAGEATVQDVLAVAQTLPMMASRRVVVVRSVERWDQKSRAAPRSKAARGSAPAPPLDLLAGYLADPSPSTVLVLTADKLDKRRKVMTAAQKAGYLVTFDELKGDALVRWVQEEAKRRNCRLAPAMAELVAEFVGPDLAPIADALERLALYAGERTVDEDVISECLVRLRTQTVWQLTEAMGRRDLGAALAAVADVYDPSDRGLRLVGLIAWSTRQMLRFASARQRGMGPPEAAKAAGAAPFKARDFERQLRHTSIPDLENLLCGLNRLDLELKGGTRRSPLSAIESMLMATCRASAMPAPRHAATRPA